MSQSRFKLLLVLLTGLTAVAGYRLVATPTPASAAVEDARWEYQSASVELGGLTGKLTELGNNGWEVINIITTDTLIDQQPDGKTHIVTQRVEVTARRPK